ncbi:hypothetical protein [Portibacter lacus]|uniref:Anti-sigma factor n=1 Tax=Portibacter lacus TaxID=1099794 RepID=A0AA37WGS3_9BACT|nr:hypothetical protein [Portibacter lacus]GLR18584.1 hypothetical protein GCM10007940_32000 [Portibacter lacus]
MSDSLEDFIRNNRAELDVDEPSINLWQGIEDKIPSQKKRKLWSSMAVAASVMVLVVAAYFMGVQHSGSDINKNLFANEQDFQEFQETNDYYTTTIDYKMSQAKDAGIDSEVLNDLKQLDEVYNELKEEMLTSDHQNKEFLINLMIKNYKTKIDILERIINKKNSNELKITDDETINI